MMDRTLEGIRCRTVRPVPHQRGFLPRQSTGTVRYALENIGRTLLHVDFDSGASLTVLAEDVSLGSGELRAEG